MVDLRDDRPPDQPVPPVVPGYSLGARLGAGGSAVVWAGTRERDGVPVAVKVVTVGLGEQADAVVRELGVLARVDVEGLVRFHEAVSLPGQDHRVALVLDHVGGGSLQGVVGARGHLSVGESVTVLAPVAKALAGLHAAGVVHGDVTPGNILLERTGRPLLADLGVARFVGEAPGEAVGTEGFVAPEVVDGGAVTSAADVYSAGALAWWCVTGQVPGPASWRAPLESLAPGLPQAWRETTTQALASDPADRPTAAELALAWFDSSPCEPLRLVVGTDETSLLTHRLRRPASEVEEPRTSASNRGVARAGPAVRTPAVLAGAGLVAFLVIGALLATGVLSSPAWLVAPGSHTEPVVDRATPAARSSPGTPGTPSSSGAPGTPTSLPATSAATPSVPPVQRDRRAPTTAARALMQELASLRARAMVSGRVADLAALDAPGSPALASDSDTLRRVRAAGAAYSGVHLTVRSARTVGATEGRASLEAVVDTAAYQVVSVTDDRRVVRTEQAVRGQTLRFALVWSGGRWLVERIEPVR